MELQNLLDDLGKCEKKLSQINNSYRIIQPPSKRPLYSQGVKGIFADVLRTIVVLLLCIAPGLVMIVVSSPSVMNNTTLMYVGIGVAFGIGLPISWIIMTILGKRDKRMAEQWTEYLHQKAEIVYHNRDLDDRKQQLLQQLSALREAVINYNEPSAPQLSDFPPEPSAPQFQFQFSASESVESKLAIERIDNTLVAEQLQSDDSSEDDNECHHCYHKFKKQYDIHTYRCCKAFKAHYNCLVAWTEFSQLCPICRKDLRDNDIGNVLASIVKVHDQV